MKKVTLLLLIILSITFGIYKSFNPKHSVSDNKKVSEPASIEQVSTNKHLNTRIIGEKEFRIGNKPLLALKYPDLIKLWGKPNEIKKLTVQFPADDKLYYSYLLQYDSIDIEMYPVEKNIPVDDTESFRFDITGSKYDFYGVKVGMGLNEYLRKVENRDVFSVQEILNDTTGEKVPQEYRKLLTLVKEKNYYADYNKAVYEQVVINDIPYGAVMLFKNDKLARIVYGYPNAS